MEKEIFKDIPGFEGLYQVSNYGRVLALDYNKWKNDIDTVNEGIIKILKLHINKNGYVTVRLSKNRKSKQYSVHRLVALTFLENKNNLPEVNHKDRNKENNYVGNLEWINHKNNSRHAMKKRIGCYKDGKLIKVYDALNDTKKDGFWISAVCLCCQGKQSQHLGYEWKYYR